MEDEVGVEEMPEQLNSTEGCNDPLGAGRDGPGGDTDRAVYLSGDEHLNSPADEIEKW